MNAVAEQSPVDRIFKRLAATYGATWDHAVGQAPIMDVKTSWGHELSSFLKSRDSMMPIAWALENLPEKCPNVIQFRNLCRQAPAADVPLLQLPKADPERVKAELAKLGSLRAQSASTVLVDHKAWAKALMRRHDLGEKLNPTVLTMARGALGISNMRSAGDRAVTLPDACQEMGRGPPISGGQKI